MAGSLTWSSKMPSRMCSTAGTFERNFVFRLPALPACREWMGLPSRRLEVILRRRHAWRTLQGTSLAFSEFHGPHLLCTVTANCETLCDCRARSACYTRHGTQLEAQTSHATFNPKEELLAKIASVLRNGIGLG